jgi:hypothetical protein
MASVPQSPKQAVIPGGQQLSKRPRCSGGRLRILSVKRNFRRENMCLLMEASRRDIATFEPYVEVLKAAFGESVALDIARYCRKARFARPRQGFLPSHVYANYLRSAYLQIPTTMAFQNAWTIYANTPLLRAGYGPIHTKWRRLIRGLYCELIGMRFGQSRLFRLGYSAAILGLVLLTVSVFASQAASEVVRRNSGIGVILTLSVLYVAAFMLIGGWLSRPKNLRPDIEAFSHVCNLLTLAPYLLDGRAFGIRILFVTILGNLADNFDSRYSRSLGLSDGPRDARTVERFALLASDIRSWQSRVAFPTGDSSRQLTADISSLGAAIATERLGDIITATSADDLPMRSATSVTRVVAKVVGRLVIAVAPGTLYVLAKYALHLELSAAVETAWVPLSLGWALTTLLSAFPDYKDRVAATTGLVGLISPTKKP